MEYYYSEDIFFFFKKKELYIWDYANHKQYLIKDPQILVDILKNSDHVDSATISNFINNNIISKESKEPSKEWKWDILSKIFHIGTQNLKPDLAGGNYRDYLTKYFQFKQSIAKEKPVKIVNGNRIKLPNPNLEALQNSSFYDALEKRKTCRNFFSQNISLEKISTILHICFGINNKISDESIKRRFAPSGGCLRSPEAYFLNLALDEIDKGIYYYDYFQNELVCIKCIDLKDEIGSILQGQELAEKLSFGIFVTSRFDLLSWKYKHSRAYRVALLDVGHVSQNFQLTATCLGIDSWITGAFNDKEINELLQLDNIDESVTFFLGGGIGDYNSYDPDFDEIRQTYHF